MPVFLYARPPVDAVEEQKIRKLAGARHAPADWIQRARIITLSWAGWHTTAIAAELHCHPKITQVVGRGRRKPVACVFRR
jgi:hypothetical protein